MHSVTISILFLAAQLLVLRASRNPPHIPEQFNATLAPSPLFNRQLDLLNIQVFSHFNSTNGTTQPLLVSENDTNKTKGIQIYYNAMTGFVYLVSNKACKKVPIDEVETIALLSLPSYLSGILVFAFNRAVRYDFVQKFSQCPYRRDVPCSQWGFHDNGILKEVFTADSIGAYIMDDGEPVAFVVSDSILVLKFETFLGGPQPDSRFLPADPDKCQPEKQGTYSIFI